jgi:hypothetical protein
LFKKDFGFLGYMDGCEAYKRYELNFLERVSETGYESTSMVEYYKNKSV